MPIPQNLARPNQPEVTGTNLPLLSTVLAGFSLTIIATLFTRPDAHLADKTANHPLINALTFLAVAIPFYVSATVFAMWGQAYKYLDLTQDTRAAINIQEAADAYIFRVFRRWRMWHRAAISAFYLGTLCFLIGICILLKLFIGSPVQEWFIGIWIATTVAGAILWWVDKQKLANP